MRWLKNVRRWFNSGSYNPADWFLDWVRGGPETDSGVEVSGKTVLTYASVWQAVNILAGDVGQLPLDVYERTDNGKQRCTDHPAQTLLRRRPNDMMNACTFRELIMSHALLWGNGRAGIVRDGRGSPIALIPFLPDRSKEEIVKGRLWHLTKLGDSNNYTPFADENVLHIKGLGFDGVTGYSVINLARNSWGLGLAAEKHGNRNFKNGARPSVILESEGRFDEPTAQKLLDDWARMHAGLDNTGRTALLQAGIKAKPLSMSNQDAEWLSTRAFQRVEVASWFNLPPHFLGDDSQDGYNSVEMRMQGYIDRTLMRWLVAWCEECHEKLLTDDQKEDDSHFVEFNTAALLRGDLKTRYSAYQIGIQSEFLSPDEVRRFENLNDRPDGKGGEYKNPNTKSNKPQQIETNGLTDPPDGDTGTNTRAYVVKRLRDYLTIEKKRVATAAVKSGNFLDWVDGFYGRWGKRLETLVVELGGEPWDAAEYVGESRRMILDLCGTVTPDALSVATDNLVADWPARADRLAEAIGA